MAEPVFHKDFKSMPWWWEWWHPTNEMSQDPPRAVPESEAGSPDGSSVAVRFAKWRLVARQQSFANRIRRAVYGRLPTDVRESNG